MSNTNKGYKAFEKGLICNPTGNKPYQFKENTVFEVEGDAKICNNGFHFCKEPLDVLNYYPLIDDNGDMTEFAEVEALEEPITNDNKKFCTKKIKIGAKISFAELVNASVKVCFEKEETKTKTTSKDSAQIGSSGDYAKIGSSGKNAVICCAGHGGNVKAKKGSWITLSEWAWVNDEYTPVCVKTVQVDGEVIKEDTYYKLENGEFKECR